MARARPARYPPTDSRDGRGDRQAIPSDVTHPRGIFRTTTGWRAFVRVSGRLYSRTFPADATLSRMKAWREEQRVRVRLGASLPAPDTTLEDDARHYLTQVGSMTTFAWRKTDILRWVKALGPDRDRASVTAGEVRAQLEQWHAEGYAPNTLNHRRSALMHMWTVLDGKSAPNPAKDVPRYQETVRPPRALSPAVIRALLAAMPPSLTRARLTLMAWTGWPHAQIRRLRPDDVDWGRAVRIAGRKKGRGVGDRWLPLLPQGWTALRAFKRAGAWGEFSTSSMRKSLRLAATKLRKNRKTPKAIAAAVEDITPYDFRHSFLTLVAVTTQNARAVQTLGLHADPRQSNRYTEAAVDPLTLSALTQMAGVLRGNFRNFTRARVGASGPNRKRRSA